MRVGGRCKEVYESTQSSKDGLHGIEEDGIGELLGRALGSVCGRCDTLL
jgi:hypothetical protein